MAPGAWQSIVREVSELAARFLADGSVAWFRGERATKDERGEEWKLRSTLHRHVARWAARLAPPSDEQETIDLLRDENKTLFRKFQNEAWSLLEARERSDWGLVFAMQHFSLPTRLLDWTESFGCALFFAQLNRKPEDEASIWVLDPQFLNGIKEALGNPSLVALGAEVTGPVTFDAQPWHPSCKSLRDLPSFAASPLYTNPRMVLQRARFTVMGDSLLPLDQQFDGALVKNGRLRRIALPPVTFDDANDFLSAAGLDAFSFFPDLHGLALKHEASVQRELRVAQKHFPDRLK